MEDFYLILMIVILSYAIAQFSKFFTHKNLTLKKFIFGTGGMPSAHTAAMVSLPVSLYIIDGLSSILVVAVVLTAVVIRDALGVRYAVGENAKILKKKFKNIVISEGHTLPQVIIGGLIGVIIPVVVLLW